jgi:hypothetical protein
MLKARCLYKLIQVGRIRPFAFASEQVPSRTFFRKKNKMKHPYSLLSKLSPLIYGAFVFAAMPAQAYDYSDFQPYSQSPPQGMSPAQIPMFVSIGFDDNGMSGLPGSGGAGGTSWFLEFIRDKNNHPGSGNTATFDGTPARITFFNRSGCQQPTLLMVAGRVRLKYL